MPYPSPCVRSTATRICSSNMPRGTNGESYITSLLAKNERGVDRPRATRRHEGGEHPDRQQRDRGGDEGDRVGTRHAIEERREQPRERDRPQRAERDADGHERGALSHDV